MVEDINIRLCNNGFERKKFNEIKSIKWMIEKKEFELLKWKLSSNELDLQYDIEMDVPPSYSFSIESHHKLFESQEIAFEDLEIGVLENLLIYHIRNHTNILKIKNSKSLKFIIYITFLRYSTRILKSLIENQFQYEINSYKLKFKKNIKYSGDVNRVNEFIDYYILKTNDNYNNNGIASNDGTSCLNIFNLYKFIYKYIEGSRSNDEYISRLKCLKDNRFNKEYPPAWNELFPIIYKYSNEKSNITKPEKRRLSLHHTVKFSYETLKWVSEISNYGYYERLSGCIITNKIQFKYSTNDSNGNPIENFEFEDRITSIIQTPDILNQVTIDFILNIVFTTYSRKVLEVLIKLSNNNNGQYFKQINNYVIPNSVDNNYLFRINEFLEYNMTTNNLNNQSFNSFIIKEIKDQNSQIINLDTIENIALHHLNELNQFSIDLILNIMFSIYSIKLYKLLIIISENHNKYNNQIINYSSANTLYYNNNNSDDLNNFIGYYTLNSSLNNNQFNQLIYEYILDSKSNDEYILKLSYIKDNRFQNQLPPTWNEILVCKFNLRSTYLISTNETVDWMYNNLNYSILQKINMKQVEFSNLITLEYAINKLDSTIFKLSHLINNNNNKSKYINHFYSNPYCEAIHNCDISILHIIDNKYPDFKLTKISFKRNDLSFQPLCFPKKNLSDDKVIQLFNYLNHINFKVFMNNRKFKKAIINEIRKEWSDIIPLLNFSLNI